MPGQWKCAHAITCYKRGDKGNQETTGPSLFRVLSMLVGKKMWKHLDQHHLISPGSLVSGLDTLHQMLWPTSLNVLPIHSTIEKKHPGLFEKLSALDVSGTLHAWLTDYLKDISLNPFRNGRESGVKKKINAGYSRLHTRPLLFIIFIDDTSQDLKNQSSL